MPVTIFNVGRGTVRSETVGNVMPFAGARILVPATTKIRGSSVTPAVMEALFAGIEGGQIGLYKQVDNRVKAKSVHDSLAIQPAGGSAGRKFEYSAITSTLLDFLVLPGPDFSNWVPELASLARRLPPPLFARCLMPELQTIFNDPSNVILFHWLSISSGIMENRPVLAFSVLQCHPETAGLIAEGIYIGESEGAGLELPSYLSIRVPYQGAYRQLVTYLEIPEEGETAFGMIKLGKGSDLMAGFSNPLHLFFVSAKDPYEI